MRDEMNIYWITKINKKRFYKTSRIEVARALQDMGHKVTLITERWIGEQDNNENTIALPTVPTRIISRLLYGIILFFYLPVHLRKKKVDAIIIDGANIWMPFMLTTRFINITLIMDIRTLSTDKELSRETLYYDTSLYFSKLIADGITTITPELKEFIEKKYRYQSKNIGIWTSGASKQFLEKPLSKGILDKELEIVSNKFYLMYHGTYEATRGLESVLDAIEKLPEENKTNLKFIIIGLNEKKIEELKKRCKEQSIHSIVKFITAVPYEAMPTYIDICDAGIIPLPPKYIWWHVCAPMKTLEYLSRAKPIIASSIPFHQRIFEKGSCGILLESSDESDIKQAIITMMENRNQLEQLGKNGKAIIQKHFTWHHSAKDLINYIEQIKKVDNE